MMKLITFLDDASEIAVRFFLITAALSISSVALVAAFVAIKMGVLFLLGEC